MWTIAQVAQQAGVSVATVSRVINGSGTVSPATQERVRCAIEKLEYRPNVWGRSLRRRESRMVLILVPNVSNPFYSPIISGVEDALRPKGYHTMLCVTGVADGRRRAFLELLHNGQADGAVLMDVTQNDKLTAELAAQYPIVQCCEYCSDPRVSHVSIDNLAAAREGVDHLIALGHRQIGFVGSTNRFISTQQRREGYEQALAAAGLPTAPEYVALADDDYSFSCGVQAAGTLLDLPRRPTALFCISDVLALGAVRAAEERGLSIPRDLTVIGFDGVEYATMFRPQLTTVGQPCYQLGQAAGELLFEQLGGAEGGRADVLSHKLVLRDSSAPAPLSR